MTNLLNNGVNPFKTKIHQISFSGLNYSVPQKRCLCLPSRSKPVLESVSGVFRTGLNAILGPTGSGKTSLMDLLAGRISRRRFSGEIRVDGHPQPDHFRFMVGYVVQEDFLEGVLTVRENVQFSASLRLSGQSLFARGSVRQRVQEVIDKLGLSEVADSRIGTAFSRGVSGGERKRAHIATELVIAPSILFLDEPTSGLDAYTALNLLHQLKSLSEEGRLIVVTLHQPRYAILRLLERVSLLSAGETVYHGEWGEVVPYFSELGFKCEEQENPGDFIMDVIFNEKMMTAAGKLCNGSTLEGQQLKLSSKFKASYHNKQLISKLEENHLPLASVASRPPKPPRYATGIFSQMLLLTHRTMLIFLRFPYAEVLQFIFNMLAICIIKFFTWNTDLSLDGLQNRLTLTITFLCLLSTICSPYLTTFFFSKTQFYFESKHCYYRVTSYFLSKVLTEIILRCLIPAIVVSLIYYVVEGFRLELGNIGIYLLVVMSQVFAETGLLSLIALSCNAEFQAQFIKGYIFFIMVSVSGFFFNINETNIVFQYLSHLSFHRLSYTTILANELSGLDFCYPLVRNLTSDGSCPQFTYPVSPEIILKSHTSGVEYLNQQGISTSQPVDIWLGIILLCTYGCVYYFLTYLRLIFFTRK